MQLSILFNYPLGQDSARISIGAANISDSNYQFRFSILSSQNESDQWLSPGWVNHNDISKLEGYIKKTSVIRLEKRDQNSNEIVKRYEWICSNIWPGEADGNAVVSVNFLL